MIAELMNRRTKMLLIAVSVMAFATTLHAQGNVVIVQAYGGGGLAGAAYQSDFIVLYNRTTCDVDLTGWSVQYASATGSSWQRTILSGSIAPNSYYLIQQFTPGAPQGAPLPPADATGSIAMSSSAGKVALLNTTALIPLGTACPMSPAIVDFLGYGVITNCSETNPTPNTDPATAAVRNNGGCTDTDNNASDFSITNPNPLNSSSPMGPDCGLSDMDCDGFLDVIDNCPNDENPGQENSDGDMLGDACDNCPNDNNPGQDDIDGDGVGNVCDNCPDDSNMGQADGDGDGIGDECDNCPNDSNVNQDDADGDGVGDACDNCVDDPNMGQANSDGDMLGDACDNCPNVSNQNQMDSDGDGIGNACDNCPNTPNPTQSDSDMDGVGNACDNCPNMPNPGQEDGDNDGVGNVCDNCPMTPNAGQADSEGDGVGDACDNCINASNPNQDDPDGDDLGSACDNCPEEPNADQMDFDMDGVGDDCDNCPSHPNPGQEDVINPGIPGGDACDLMQTNLMYLDFRTPMPANNGGEDDCTGDPGSVCNPDENGRVVVYLYASNVIFPETFSEYQAFVDYDESLLTYEPMESCYLSEDDLNLHATLITEAGSVPGESGRIILDGASLPLANISVPQGTRYPLARLVFTISQGNTCDFDPFQFIFVNTQNDLEPFLSQDGVRLDTSLVNSPLAAPDTEPPVIICPRDVMVQCDNSDPDALLPTATGTATIENDNCDPMPELSYTDVMLPGSCPSEFNIERTWTATDFCGNASSCVQIIEVVDTTAPVVSMCYGVQRLPFDECMGEVEFSATITDNCCVENAGISASAEVYLGSLTIGNASINSFVPVDDGIMVVGTVPVSELQDCSATVRVIVSATDCCGNATHQPCQIDIKVADNQAPEIMCPPETTAICAEYDDPMITGMATAMDNCDAMPVITYTDEIIPGDLGDPLLPNDDIPPMVIRTWIANDVCHNQAECTQKITIDGVVQPEIECPPNYYTDCLDDPIYLYPLDQAQFEMLGGTINDNDCGPLTFELDEEIPATLGNSCPDEPVIVIRFYKVTNIFGASARCKHVIVVQDDVPPVIAERMDPCPYGGPTTQPVIDPQGFVDTTYELQGGAVASSASFGDSPIARRGNNALLRGGDVGNGKTGPQLGDCDFLRDFYVSITDCRVDPHSIVVKPDIQVEGMVESAEVYGTPFVTEIVPDKEYCLSGQIIVRNLTSCEADVTVTVVASDYCENQTAQPITFTVERDAPMIYCPSLVGGNPYVDVHQGGTEGLNGDSEYCEPLRVYADAGSCDAVVNFEVMAEAACSGEIVSVDCTPPSGSTFPQGVTEVTCVATDECGRTAQRTFEVEVIGENLVDAWVVIQDISPNVVDCSMGQTRTRCIRFWPRAGANCSASVYGVGEFGWRNTSDCENAGPFEAQITFAVPCNENWTSMCAKDELSTLSDQKDLEVDAVTARYLVNQANPLTLRPGDNNNNDAAEADDIGFLILQFQTPGEVIPEIACGDPFVAPASFSDGRNADHNLSGDADIIGQVIPQLILSDFDLIDKNFLAVGACDCIGATGVTAARQLQVGGVGHTASSMLIDDLRRIDFNGDNRFDYLDVQIFEQRHGLSDNLSTEMNRVQMEITVASELQSRIGVIDRGASRGN